MPGGREEEKCQGASSIYDWILLSLVVASTIPFVAANGALILWRRRKYFEAQGGVFLIVSSSLAGLVWIYSSFLGNGHFNKQGLFKNCFLWNSVRVLGVSLWFTFTIIRFHRMQLLSKGFPDWQTKKYISCTVMCTLPVLVLVLVSLRFQAYVDRENCVLKWSWELAGWVLICAPYLLVSAALLFAYRKETHPLLVTEFMQSCEYLTMAFMIVLLASTAILTDGRKSISGRCFLTFCTCCLVFLHFWVRFAHPVYLCVCKPEQAMDSFEKESGARALQVGNTMYSQSSYPQSSEGATLEAYYKAVNEVDFYRDIVVKLKQEKESLKKHLDEIYLRSSGIGIEKEFDFYNP